MARHQVEAVVKVEAGQGVEAVVRVRVVEAQVVVVKEALEVEMASLLVVMGRVVG
jgi:hypothetical protein